MFSSLSRPFYSGLNLSNRINQFAVNNIATGNMQYGGVVPNILINEEFINNVENLNWFKKTLAELKKIKKSFNTNVEKAIVIASLFKESNIEYNIASLMSLNNETNLRRLINLLNQYLSQYSPATPPLEFLYDEGTWSPESAETVQTVLANILPPVKLSTMLQMGDCRTSSLAGAVVVSHLIKEAKLDNILEVDILDFLYEQSRDFVVMHSSPLLSLKEDNNQTHLNHTFVDPATYFPEGRIILNNDKPYIVSKVYPDYRNKFLDKFTLSTMNTRIETLPQRKIQSTKKDEVTKSRQI